MPTLLYPKAIWDPAPAWKQGYTAYPSPQNKEGFVLHSMEGGFSAARQRLFGPDQASWQFSVNKGGAVIQHYDPRAVAWHCGEPGDNNPMSAAIGNVALIGIEHEGRAGEPLTALQLAASIELQQWCYSILPTIKPPALRASHWEHGWISNTSCPSNRIPWSTILAGMEVDDITKDEAKAAFKEVLMDPAAFPELNGKSVITHLQASDDWVLDTIRDGLRSAADRIDAQTQ